MPHKKLELALYNMDDTFNNLRALQKFLLFVLENTNEGEFLALKGEIVTMLYLLGEQVEGGQAKAEEASRHISAVNHPPPRDPAPAPA